VRSRERWKYSNSREGMQRDYCTVAPMLERHSVRDVMLACQRVFDSPTFATTPGPGHVTISKLAKIDSDAQ
jgi:hypothetical protein